MDSIRSVIIAVGMSVAALGQTQQEWTALEHIKPGERIRVVQANGKGVTAEFQGWTAESLRVGTVQLPRTDIVRVERRQPGAWTRGKKVGMFALIGMGAGMAIGAALPVGCSATTVNGAQKCGSRSEGVGVIGMLGLAGGALVGGALPLHGTETLYTRK